MAEIAQMSCASIAVLFLGYNRSARDHCLSTANLDHQETMHRLENRIELEHLNFPTVLLWLTVAYSYVLQ